MSSGLSPLAHMVEPGSRDGQVGVILPARPVHKALDLFCCAGGATKGLQRAGFHVTGIDNKPQPNYCGDAFIQADALNLPVQLEDFDFIWASPPCQAYSWSAKRWNIERADLVEPTRQMLGASGRPFCIENVPGAPIRADIVLTGTMFGLGVIRRRHFETNWFCLAPLPVRKRGSVRDGDFVTVAGHGGDGRAALYLWKRAMGIDWMSRDELTQAIPPAYSEFIGRAFLAQYHQHSNNSIPAVMSTCNPDCGGDSGAGASSGDGRSRSNSSEGNVPAGRGNA